MRKMIIVSKKADNKMFKFAEKVLPDEIGGLLIGEIDGDDILVNDIIVLKQKKSCGTFDMDDEAFMDFTKEADAETLNSVIGWWHSHGNGGTFWSCTDDDCFKRLCGLAGSCVGVVIAHPYNPPGSKITFGRDRRYRVLVRRSYGVMINVDGAEHDIRGRKYWASDRDIDAEIEEKVTTEKFLDTATRMSVDDEKFLAELD